MPNHAVKVAGFLVVAAALVAWGSPPLALAMGILFAVSLGHPFAHLNRHLVKWLLQASVVLLGFGMNFGAVLRLGAHGFLFAATSIAVTLVLGTWLGRRFALDGKTTALISAGTAICGGSAIAAVSSVLAASEAQIAVAIGTVFLLNAVALYVFPAAGHLLHLSQAQFGLWAGVAIHDISSVVGAGLSYGTVALQSATAVKLARTLWIVPLTLGIALRFGRRQSARIGIPWFIGLFLLASLLRGWIPAVAACSPVISDVARRGMILVLFLIGASLSTRSLREVGWTTAAVGLILWAAVSLGSLAAISWLHLQA
jgi:uncharacterized integral membrane protein (TIGR00698 family)